MDDIFSKSVLLFWSVQRWRKWYCNKKKGSWVFLSCGVEQKKLQTKISAKNWKGTQTNLLDDKFCSLFEMRVDARLFSLRSFISGITEIKVTIYIDYWTSTIFVPQENVTCLSMAWMLILWLVELLNRKDKIMKEHIYKIDDSLLDGKLVISYHYPRR